MGSITCVEQKGVVEQVSNGLAKVNLTSFSACAHCQSKAACGITESVTKHIYAPVGDTGIVAGETVRILMKKSLGIKASLLAYFIPFILVIVAVLIFTALHMNELTSGLLSLGILVPYFLILYIFRDLLTRTFTFTLQKELGYE